jgi:hypothetical protein
MRPCHQLCQKRQRPRPARFGLQVTLSNSGHKYPRHSNWTTEALCIGTITGGITLRKRPVLFWPNLPGTRFEDHARQSPSEKKGIAITTPQNRYSIGQTLCDVGSAITSRINKTVCVVNAPSKIANGIRTPPEPADASPPPVGSPCPSCERRTWNSGRNEQRKITASQAGQMAGYLSSRVGPAYESPFLINRTSEIAPIAKAHSS